MFVFALIAVLSSVDATPLDDYMKLPDAAYSWQLVNSFRPPLFDVTIYNVFLTSQTWLRPNDSSIYTWQHWLVRVAAGGGGGGGGGQAARGASGRGDDVRCATDDDAARRRVASLHSGPCAQD